MKNTLILIGLLLSPLLYSQGGEKNFIDQNYIELTGKAEMEVIPDLIYLNIIISEKDTKNKVPVNQLEKKMIKKLQELSIDISSDLSIKDLSSNFKNYLLSKDDIHVSKQYQLLLHDGAMASRVLIELEKIGISNISIGHLDHSRMTEFRKEVKIMALKAAKEKANSLAEAIGQHAGKALYIKELETYSQPYRAANTLMLRTMDDAQEIYQEPDIDFEKLKLEYSVLCRFELKD